MKATPAMLFVAILLVVVAGCRVWQPVTLEDVPTVIEAGDNVKVQVRDGREVAFEVQSVDSHELVGPYETIPLTEIVYLERRRFAPVRTFFYSLGLGVTATAVLLTVFLLSIGFVIA